MWAAICRLTVTFHRVYAKGMKVPLPERPWYAWKEDLSFADLVRAAQETLRGMDVQDWAVGILKNDPNVFKKAIEEKKAVELRSTEAPEKTKAA